jgi:hypothetical protein
LCLLATLATGLTPCPLAADGLRIPGEEVHAVDEVIRSRRGLWGKAAIEHKDGPSYEFFEKLLPPIRYVNTSFHHYPLVLCAPRTAAKARFVGNGSGVNLSAHGAVGWRDVGFVEASAFFEAELLPPLRAARTAGQECLARGRVEDHPVDRPLVRDWRSRQDLLDPSAVQLPPRSSQQLERLPAFGMEGDGLPLGRVGHLACAVVHSGEMTAGALRGEPSWRSFHAGQLALAVGQDEREPAGLLGTAGFGNRVFERCLVKHLRDEHVAGDSDPRATAIDVLP